RDTFSAMACVAVSGEQQATDINAIGFGTVSATESFRGFGVVGLSMLSRALTESGTVPRPERGRGTGTIKFVDARLGGGTGVLGATGIFPRGALGTSTGVVGAGGTGVLGVGHWAGVEGSSSDSGHAVIG